MKRSYWLFGAAVLAAASVFSAPGCGEEEKTPPLTNPGTTGGTSDGGGGGEAGAGGKGGEGGKGGQGGSGDGGEGGGTAGGGGSSSGGGGEGGSGTGGQGTGGQGTGGQAQGGEGGSKPECLFPTDCPGEDEACEFRTCESGKCGVTFAGSGTPAVGQPIGDCKVLLCDGKGGTKSEVDDLDVPAEGQQCAKGACDSGVPKTTNEPSGTPCAQSGGTLCDGKGNCVECLVDDDCPTKQCEENQCSLPSACDDNQKNGSETDIDCGGSCPACDVGQGCGADTDCVTQDCGGNPKVCQPPPAGCDDGLKNGTETDVDCGGAQCPDCVEGKTCKASTDCVTELCLGGYCVGSSTLNDCDKLTAENKVGQAKVTVKFGGALGNAYAPKCFIVSMNTELAFEGSFKDHPLAGGVVLGGQKLPDPQSPFMPVTSQGSSKTFKMAAPGDYGFYCDIHALGGMAGAVFVVP